MSELLSEAATNALIWSFTSVAITTTAIRLYTRQYLAKAFGLDDALILFGQLVAIALAAVATWVVSLIWDASDAGTRVLSCFISSAIYTLTIPIIKCSILAFYKRITPVRKQRLILYSISLFILVQAIACFMLTIFSLDPPTAWLNIFERAYNVVAHANYVQMINSGFQVLYDITLLVLPLPIIIKTSLIRRDRVTLIIIYIFCAVSLAATIIRLTQIAAATGPKYYLNIILDGSNYECLTVIEVMTATICANVPSMPLFFRHLFQGTRKTFSASSGSDNRQVSKRPLDTLSSSFKESPHPSWNDEDSMAQMKALRNVNNAEP